MKVKRLICIVLVIAAVCLAAACNAGSGSSGNTNNNTGSGSTDNNTSGGNTGGGSPDSNTNNGNAGGGSPDNNTSGGNTGGGSLDNNTNNGNTGGGSPDSNTSNGNTGGGSPDNNTSNGNTGGGNTDNGTNGGNGGTDNNGDQNLTGSAADILNEIVGDITAAGVEMPMSIPPMPVTSDMSQNTVGLSEADFNKYVVDSAYNMAAIGTFAHQLIVLKAVDAKAAGEINKLVSSDNGYDAKKWVCVFPDKAAVVDAGEYVLIAAASTAVVDAAVDAFKSIMGSIGDVNTFWEFAGE